MIQSIIPEQNNSINVDDIKIDNSLLNYYTNFVKIID